MELKHIIYGRLVIGTQAGERECPGPPPAATKKNCTHTPSSIPPSPRRLVHSFSYGQFRCSINPVFPFKMWPCNLAARRRGLFHLCLLNFWSLPSVFVLSTGVVLCVGWEATSEYVLSVSRVSQVLHFSLVTHSQRLTEYSTPQAPLWLAIRISPTSLEKNKINQYALLWYSE
jgi:hypothetical protein